jgi:RNA polymerase sigma-70 factor, ECF subfamily
MTGPLTGSTATEDLVRKLQSGDKTSLERLWKRYLPRLKRWAHGRLPSATRDETDDLIQDTFVRTMAHLRTLQPRGPNSVFAYFRTVMLNQVRDHARRATCRPQGVAFDEEEHVAPGGSPLQQLLGQEIIERYTRALESLTEHDQQMVVAFVELRCSDQELAELFEKTSADAARKARNRAVARLAEAMNAMSDLHPSAPDGR